MCHNEVKGLRVFLLTTLKLLANGNKESCSYVETMLAKGIATVLLDKYSDYSDNGLAYDNAVCID